MSVEQFIDQIAGKGLLDEALLQRLRRDAAAAENQWTPEDVVKFLVEQGHLTRFQGKNLLKEIQTVQPATHESLDLAPSGSIDGLSIGVVSDDDDDDVEIIDLEAAVPPSVAADHPQAGNEGIVDVSQANMAEAHGLPPQSPVQEVMAGQAVHATLQSTSPAEGDGMLHAEASGMADAAGYEDVMVPTSLLDKQFNNQIWDKRFLYATISVLLLLVGGAAVFYFVINNKSADVKIEAAREAYGSSQYDSAIVELLEFAKQFPNDKRSDEAMALVYLSRIHLAVATGQQEAIEQVEEAITTGKDIPGFSSRARDELKVVLPRFSESFLVRAETANVLEEKKEYYQFAVDALELINLPGALGTTRSESAVRTKLEDLDERLASVKRHVDRDSHMRVAMNEMAVAVSENKVAAAFESRRQLHDLYPELKGDRRLSSVLSQMHDAERALVKKVPAKWQAVTDPKGLVSGAPVTATTVRSSIPDVNGQVAVLAGGNVVGLNVADGTVLWQQFVGLQTTVAPIQVGTSSVFANQTNSEVLSVQSADGTLNWHLGLEGDITSVSVQGNNTIVTLSLDNGGVMLVLDSVNGNIETQINTSLGLMSAPAFNRDGTVVYLVADHSYVYAISLESGKCLDVYFLNHGVGTVPYPPVQVNGYVLVAQNLDEETGLHALLQEGQGRFAKSGDVVRVPGMLSSEVRHEGNRLLVTTESGEIRLFDIQHQDDLVMPVIVPLAATRLETEQPARHFVEMESRSVKVGAAGLTGFSISVDGQLNETSRLYLDDVLVAPTVTRNAVTVSQRIRAGASALTVSGSTGNGEGNGWETDLAALSDSAIVTNDKTVVTVDSQAQVFDAMKGGNSAIAQTWTGGRGYSHAVSVGDRLVLQSLTGASDLLVFDSVGEGESASRIELQELTGQPVGPGVAFNGQLLLPLNDGQITLFDVASGNQTLVAYQPVKEPEEVVRWSVAALPSDNANSFVVVRDRRSLQKIGVSPSPVPHLALQAEAVFEVPVYNQVAATGETVYLIRRGRNNDEIVGLSYDTLEELNIQEVAGRVIWGPNRLDDVVLVYTSASRVYCFDGQQKLLWRSGKVDLSPVGGGIVDGENFLITGVEGTLWRLNSTTGETVDASPLNKRVVGTPFKVVNEVWVPTEAGIVSGALQE